MTRFGTGSEIKLDCDNEVRSKEGGLADKVLKDENFDFKNLNYAYSIFKEEADGLKLVFHSDCSIRVERFLGFRNDKDELLVIRK